MSRLRPSPVFRLRHILPFVALFALTVALAACGAKDGSTSSGSGGDAAKTDKPIIFGLATAASGPIAPFDMPAVEVLENRVAQVNQAGGVDGRKIEVIKRNTQSDPTKATNAATELVEKGASVIFTSCDFDFGSPAAGVATSAGVVAYSLCAGDPKFANKKTLGPLAFTPASGSNAEGTTIAEWSMEKKGWKRAYILQDESIEYTKTVGKYFQVRWKELGGEIVGKDSFPGGEAVNIRSQAAKIRQAAKGVDVIVLPSWLPGAATAIKQLRDAGVDLPIISGAAVAGTLLFDVAGKNVSNVYAVTVACFDPWCRNTPTPDMNTAVEQIKEATGKIMPTATPLVADTAVLGLVEAFRRLGGDPSGEQLARELESMPEVKTLAGTQHVASKTCNMPTDFPYYVIRTEGDRFEFEDRWTANNVPEVNDGNESCAGKSGE